MNAGRPVAALSLAAPVFNRTLEELDRFAPQLIQAAREIELQLPATGPLLVS